MSGLVKMLLEKRGMTTDTDIAAFLSPDYDLHTHDPFLLQGMDLAVERIFNAIEKGERIVVYADFDCDGIPGASVLHDFFRKIGYANIAIYLPHRDREGYGFHIDAIERLAKEGTKLIITVDVGTTAIESVAHARALGVDVIVTDHHEIPGELPNAIAVLNPKRAPYPFPNLCGAAVAFKLVQALLIEGRKRSLAPFVAIPLGWEKWLLDLVAIATVADLVPLVGENRTLAYWGLRVLRKSPRPGIMALCSSARVKRQYITEEDIGFAFAPRLNAASRMDSPDLAFTLLTTESADEAERIAAELESLNASRKGIVGGIVKEAKKRAQARFTPDQVVGVLGDTTWKPALLGLAANSLLEGGLGMVCLWGRDVNGKLKGSCRSDGSLSVVEVFTSASDIFETFGGHHASGGFTLKSEHVHTMQEVLNAAGLELADKANARPEIAPDAQLELREVSDSLLRGLQVLAPFGVGNPKPIFKIRARVMGVNRFGKEKNHVEVQLRSSDTDASCRAFQFFKGPENFTQPPILDEEISVLGTIERDIFRRTIALRILDIVAS